MKYYEIKYDDGRATRTVDKLSTAEIYELFEDPLIEMEESDKASIDDLRVQCELELYIRQHNLRG